MQGEACQGCSKCRVSEPCPVCPKCQANPARAHPLIGAGAALASFTMPLGWAWPGSPHDCVHPALGEALVGFTTHLEQTRRDLPHMHGSTGELYLAIAEACAGHPALGARLAGFTLHLEQTRRDLPCTWSRPGEVHPALGAAKVARLAPLGPLQMHGKPHRACSKCMVSLAGPAPNAW